MRNCIALDRVPTPSAAWQFSGSDAYQASNPALGPTAASGFGRLAVPSSLRFSAAARPARWASHDV